MQNHNWKNSLFKLALVGVAADGPVVLEHAASAATPRSRSCLHGSYPVIESAPLLRVQAEGRRPA